MQLLTEVLFLHLCINEANGHIHCIFICRNTKYAWFCLYTCNSNWEVNPITDLAFLWYLEQKNRRWNITFVSNCTKLDRFGIFFKFGMYFTIEFNMFISDINVRFESIAILDIKLPRVASNKLLWCSFRYVLKLIRVDKLWNLEFKLHKEA